MPFPSIIYWKWDDSHLLTGKYREQIDDLLARSTFSHIYITTHWCHNGLTNPETQACLKATAQQLHSAGRNMILEVDVRAEKARFAAEHPDDRAGFLYWKTAALADGACSFTIKGSEGKELFGGDYQSGDELLTATAYQTDDRGFVMEDSLHPVKAVLSRTDSATVTVKWTPKNSGEQLFVAVWSLFDFPDLYSHAYYAESEKTMNLASAIGADGAALDELCFMWHPDFDFTPGSYMAMDNCPIYSRGMYDSYAAKFGRDYITDCLFRYASSNSDPRRIAATNRYFKHLREGIAQAENTFYKQVKRYLGEDAFVGVHNTWFCIEEVQNSPEIWRTGITWWSVEKDFGFTDEIMLYPVRTALAHKASAPLFYNMWYSEGTQQLSTFFPEMWRNIRHGGRTISLSYECFHERFGVQQLYRPGELEAVAAIEKKIAGVDEFVKSPARCDVAIVTSLAALCNRKENVDGNGRWDSFGGKLKEVFTLTRDLWIAGWNCDLIGDNEIYDKHLFINKEGYLCYGNQVYTCLILAFPQFAQKELTSFLAELAKSNTRIIVVGNADTDFDGETMESPAKALPHAPYFPLRPEIGDITALLEEWGIQTNRVPCGCIMQDGTVVLTCSSPDKPTGNPLHSRFVLNGKSITVDGTDVVCLRMENGDLKYWSNDPVTVREG